MKEHSRRLVNMNLRRERARANFVRTFARTLRAEEELEQSCQLDDPAGIERDLSDSESTASSGESTASSGESHEGSSTPEADAGNFVAAALSNMLH